MPVRFLKKIVKMKNTLIIILLAVIAVLMLSDRFVKCRKTEEGNEMLDLILLELEYMNNGPEN